MNQDLMTHHDRTTQGMDGVHESVRGYFMHHLLRTGLAAAAISWGSFPGAFAADLASETNLDVPAVKPGVNYRLSNQGEGLT